MMMKKTKKRAVKRVLTKHEKLLVRFRNVSKELQYERAERRRLLEVFGRERAEHARVAGVLGPFQVALLGVLRPVFADYERRIEALEGKK